MSRAIRTFRPKRYVDGRAIEKFGEPLGAKLMTVANRAARAGAGNLMHTVAAVVRRGDVSYAKWLTAGI